MKTIRRPLAVLLAGLALMIGNGSVQPITAAAAPEAVVATSQIWGSVWAGATAMPAVRVEARLNGVVVRSTNTGSNGGYALTGLAAGNYNVVVDSPTIVRAQRTVAVATASTVRGIRFDVVKSSTVQGVVSLPGGTVAAAAKVELVSSPTAATAIATVTASATGFYRFNDVTPAVVYVRASKPGLLGWHGSTTPATATALNVGPGVALIAKHVQLAATGGPASISGFLSTSTGQGANGSVKVYKAAAPNDFVGAFPTVDGRWSTGPLPSGSYLLQFTAPGETSEWWPDVDNMDQATPLVLAGTPLEINESLEARTELVARVLEPDYDFPSNALVVVYRLNTNIVVAVGTTDASGIARVGGLRTNRTYHVEARPPSGSALLNSVRIPLSVHSPALQYLTLNLQTGEPTAPSLQGVLTTSTGAMANGAVKVYRAGTNEFVRSFNVVNGNWNTGLLPAGQYLVLFTAPGETSEWWADTDSMDKATPVNPGAFLSAQLEARTSRDVRVTRPDGSSISNALVVAYKWGTEDVVAVATTDQFGRASLGGLRAGLPYAVEARPPSGSALLSSNRELMWTLCCHGQLTLALRSPAGAGMVSGFVYGGPATVELWSGTATPVLVQSTDTAFTNSLERFYFDAVPYGSYYVRFRPKTGHAFQFTPEWAWESATLDTASRFVVNSTTPNHEVSATLGEARGWIYAYIDGPPWFYGSLGDVQVFRSGSGELVQTFAFTGTGSSSFWLDPGTYVLRFVPNASSGLAEEWYDDAASFGTATVLTIGPGTATRAMFSPDLAPGATASEAIITATHTPNERPTRPQ